MIFFKNGNFLISLIKKDNLNDSDIFFPAAVPKKNFNALSVAGRTAAAELFCEYFKNKYSCMPHRSLIENLKIDYGCFGKPYLADYPDFHYNISHSGDYAVAVYSNKNDIGIDIEKIRPFNIRVAEKCFSEVQLQKLISADRDKQEELFILFWTQKEAMIKADGLSIYSETDFNNNRKPSISLFYPKNYIITIAHNIEKS